MTTQTSRPSLPNEIYFQDIPNRYVGGWLIAPRENAVLARQLIADTLARHDVMSVALTLHAVRGASMRSKPVASLLVDLDVAKSHTTQILERQPLPGVPIQDQHKRSRLKQNNAAPSI